MYRLGIDLGGTKIALGIVDENAKIIKKKSVKTNRFCTAEQMAQDIAAAVKDIIESAGITKKDISFAGIGVPGAVDCKKGIDTFSNNLGFHNANISLLLKERTGFDFRIANDANAAAIGEYIAGSGKGCRSFITVTLGTGIGGGIIIDGKLFTGKNGAAAEPGHAVIVKDGIKCSCGRRGCFEQYASATALIRQTKEEMQKSPDSVMWEICEGNIDNANGKTAFDAMHKGDKAAKTVVENYIEYLAVGITDLVNIFQPDIISIGGGISGSKDDIIPRLQKTVKEENFARYMDNATEIKAALLGNDAGIIGAAFLDKA